MSMRRTLFCLLAIAAMTGPLAAQSPPAVPADKVAAKTVAFKLLPSRHMLIRAEINGKGPFSLIFDTGAPINLVSSGLAKKAGIKSGGFSLFSGPKPVNVKSFTVDNVTAANLPVLVMDHPTVETISEVFEDKYGPIDGIIGFPFFARYAMTVDYQRQRLTLIPNGYKPGDYLGDLIGRINQLSEDANRPRVVAPAGLWGVSVSKPDGDEKGGVVVDGVADTGPAGIAGLRKGDRLLTIDGRWTDTVADTFQAVALVRPGRSVVVVYERDGQKRRAKVVPKTGL